MSQQIGKYRLVRHLASGGMAELHLAQSVKEPDPQKLVVLKQVAPKFARNGEYTTMFLDEARLGASLSHPNIVKIHEVGFVDGAYFFTMEYMRGCDLSRLMEKTFMARRRFPIQASLRIITQACAGLHYAHEKRDNTGASLNLIHRDVSPQNVFVGYDGAVKLIDFGLVKAHGRNTETQVGQRKGKLAYMSPEQAKAQPLDRRADVFSLTAVLWELITARRLFDGPDDFQTMQLIIREPIASPGKFIPNFDPELERIVMTGLARDPAQRYPTAEALRTDLEAFAGARNLNITPEQLGEFVQTTYPP